MVSIDRADLHRPIDELLTERLDVVERSPDIMGGLAGIRQPHRQRAGLST